MRILILGGTVFLGRHIVERALARGHAVTLFNRGRSAKDLFANRSGVETRKGDRETGLAPLADGRWDAVVDTCGYVPRVVAASAELLARRADHYVFISTQSVYADDATPGQDEDAPLVELEDESVEEVTDETYGGLKALCERAVERFFEGRALHVRSGLIVGPHDPSDRFTYWPVRVARGGRVLAPAPRDFKTEFVDVRDLAAFVVHAVEQRHTGTLNTSGPTAGRISFGELLDACGAHARRGGVEAGIAWADEDWLAARGVALWTDLPLRVPKDMAGFATRSVDRARTAGLEWRPVEETIRDTLQWAGPDRALRTGLVPERERELLLAWDNRGA